MGSVDWWALISTLVGAGIGALVNWGFARRSSIELRREAEILRAQTEKSRQLTIRLMQILDGAGLVDIKEWDPKTGEPSKWPVTGAREIGWSMESTESLQSQTRPWWRRVFGG